MPTTTNQDVTLYANKDYTLEFTEVDGEDLTSFNAIQYAVADSPHSDSNHFTKSKSGGGITVSGAGNDVAAVTIDAADTSGLSTVETYHHELVTEDSSGNTQVAAVGTVTLHSSAIQ